MAAPGGKCYNNPAFCNKFDTSLYDYEYIPEIDPDSPDLNVSSNRRRKEPKMVHPYHGVVTGQGNSESEGFDDSDESNRSIVVEERNNRRVTMICEKRNKADYDAENGNCVYYQDISLESEEGDLGSQPVKISTVPQRQSNPQDVRSHYPRQRQHRYEEIGDDDGNWMPSRTVHRYAELSHDENPYPSLGQEVRIQEGGFRGCHPWRDTARSMPESRTTSPTFHPSETYQRTISPHPPDMFHFRPNSPCSPYGTSPLIEMADFSPPQRLCTTPTEVMHPCLPRRREASSFRQPPIGASSPIHVHETQKPKTMLHKIINPMKKHPGTPEKQPKRPVIVKTTPRQGQGTPKTSTPRPKIVHSDTAFKTPTRRNISTSFSTKSPSKHQVNFSASPITKLSNPYRPTTQEVANKTTAIITPILQRKKTEEFERVSQMFQSTGNLHPQTIIEVDGNVYELAKPAEPNRTISKMKRNQSVPNFSQSFVSEKRTPKKTREEARLDLQYSPTKSMGRVSPIDRSRLSLVDHKSSWSNIGSDTPGPPVGCLMLAALVQLITGIAICGITFYLLSKLGRRYYLDFGMLAGFVSFVLGALGFRSHCWKWLPNRNYVSGYIVLGAFSMLTCGGLVVLITARPMAGDPLLDVTGGAICGVSMLIIFMAILGLTMSSCCKSPPPDNRVTHV